MAWQNPSEAGITWTDPYGPGGACPHWGDLIDNAREEADQFDSETYFTRDDASTDLLWDMSLGGSTQVVSKYTLVAPYLDIPFSSDPPNSKLECIQENPSRADSSPILYPRPLG